MGILPCSTVTSPKSSLSAPTLRLKPNQEKEVRTSDVHQPKGVPTNYVLHAFAVISYSIRPIISMQIYILHVIILLAFFRLPTSCPRHPLDPTYGNPKNSYTESSKANIQIILCLYKESNAINVQFNTSEVVTANPHSTVTDFKVSPLGKSLTSFALVPWTHVPVCLRQIRKCIYRNKISRRSSYDIQISSHNAAEVHS